jgi:hypothetical protein
VEGIPARELEPTTTYRLGGFMRWVEKPQVTGKILNDPLTFLR